MLLPLLIAAYILGTAAILAWLALLFHPARPWDMRPVAEEIAPPPDPAVWPPVVALVPARNEADSLPRTLPNLLKQDYPGDFHVILIDDRSEDGTAERARKIAEEAGLADRLTVLTGQALPEGWMGKVWALEQGRTHCDLRSAECGAAVGAVSAYPQSAIRNPQFYLLTDADIRHAPGSLRRLVSESAADGLALNSRMARLRCEAPAEKLLIPPFVFFFSLLYPMRRVNDPDSPVAAAAGGCVLVARDALERAGGFGCIKGEVIDDINLARCIKAPGAPIRLALSRGDVESLRAYETLSSIWHMVRRTAFTQLRHSTARLAASQAGLAVLFALPPLLFFAGLGFTLAAACGAIDLAIWLPALLAAKGLFAWALMAGLFRPAVEFFGLSSARAFALPLAAVLYGAMTLDSARRHWLGRGLEWREGRGRAS